MVLHHLQAGLFNYTLICFHRVDKVTYMFICASASPDEWWTRGPVFSYQFPILYIGKVTIILYDLIVVYKGHVTIRVKGADCRIYH